MRISEIRIYPVKGLRGLSVPSATIEPWGLAGDRRWMIVDAAGRFLSQREVPAMAMIDATLEAGGLKLSASRRSDLVVATAIGAPTIDVVIWRNTVSAAPTGPEADAWLSEALGRHCRLVHMAEPERARPVNPAFGAAEDRVSFADGYPMLATTTASLADLARRAALPHLSMDRFRTNLVVDGAAAWEEDGWRELEIGSALFAVVKPCERCAVTTVDQTTGERHPDIEPLRTLSTFRRNERGQPVFGQNLIPRSSGVVRVGEAVIARG